MLSKRIISTLLFSAGIILVLQCANSKKLPYIMQGQGMQAGEVTADGVILMCRLTASDTLMDGEMPGSPGMGRFEVSPDTAFEDPLKTAWYVADTTYDYIIKTRVTGLTAGTRYYYRLRYGANSKATYVSAPATFRTLNPEKAEPVSFTVVTGMHYYKFHRKGGKKHRACTGDDCRLGFPGLASILRLQPDSFIGTGDNVYYDHPRKHPATEKIQLRQWWHQQFSAPRFRELFASVPVYWEKDDHDHRYNDCDTTGNRPPSSALGSALFTEQVPVTDPEDKDAVTYRTHRLNKLAQIWLVEGRDYRSPNKMPDGPGKSLWGVVQKKWLQETLLASDAPFKFLISPTPLVGPDDAYKKDNHTNPKGFRHEGDTFFAWLKENGFLKKNFYIICGDRHWQYHAVRPDGFEEFSCGALVDANSRLGRKAGDKKSTDPKGLIKQPYLQDPASGGFLKVTVSPGNHAPQAEFSFHDEHGVVLYSVVKNAY